MLARPRCSTDTPSGVQRSIQVNFGLYLSTLDWLKMLTLTG